MLFEEEVYNQYLLIASMMLILILIKYYTIQKAYKNKLTAFVHPSTILHDLTSKIKQTPNSDPRMILSLNLKKVHEDYSRLRNIAMLMAYMEQEKINLQPFCNKVEKEVGTIEEKSLLDHELKYKEYILEFVGRVRK